MNLLRGLLLIFIAGIVYICWIQGNTIEQQKKLIREMMKNPQCLVPETPKQPATGRRGEIV